MMWEEGAPSKQCLKKMARKDEQIHANMEVEDLDEGENIFIKNKVNQTSQGGCE